MDLRAYIEDRCTPIPFCGCWLWLRSFGSHGYGNASMPSERVVLAHRVSYVAFKGPIPDGCLIQHSCDQKWCVNPDHLSIGTDATNAWDKQRKGRAAKKIDEDMAVAFVVLHGERVPKRVIASAFGVSQRIVQKVIAGEAWRHVTEGMR